METAIDAKFVKFDSSKQLRYGNIYRNLKQYFRVLRKIKEYEIRQQRIKHRKNITRPQYEAYCKLFFREVSKEVLRGKVYKFEKRLGCLIIERVIVRDSFTTADGKVVKFKKVIDYYKTELNKRNLLAQGLIPYNKKDHAAALLRGEKYEGIKYVEYLDNPYYCKLLMIDGTIKNRPLFKFYGTNLHMKRSNDDILSECKTVEDIINVDTDINNRLSLINKFDPSYTIKYIRNNEQRAIFRRNYYRKT